MPDISHGAGMSKSVGTSGYLATEASRVQFINRRANKKGYHFTHRIGEASVLDFFNNYKNLKKSVEREEHLKEPQTAFLFQC